VTRRFMSLAVSCCVVFGLVDSALAIRSTARASRHRAASVGRAPAKETLALPRARRPTPPGEIDPLGLRVRAASAILMDAHSGAVLYERSPDAPRPPASVTKILTALVILEHGKLEDTVVVSQAAARTGGHRLGLRAGQRVSLGDLLAAVLIRSANDAAVAAAEHVGGGLGGFVALMNAKASQLGMLNSQFANPHGLDEASHYTTARDMALLTRVALDHPTFAELVRSRQARLTIWKPGRRRLVPQIRIVQSHNRLLGQLNGADGVKTGYTDSAGRCLVASASRGSQRMIAVLLNDPRRWNDAAALLEYGFGSLRGPASPRPAGGPWHPQRAEGWPWLEAQAWLEERP
jgi:serine-type D-Ala-D-Ala carboxypeptidase (penicillin-binding protein 5/6)